jgi:hypothetical protein
MNLTPFKLLLFCTCICLVLAWVFALNGYPLFIDDSDCFLPTAHFINHYNLLIDTLYDPQIGLNDKFLFYPPLFPYVIALLVKLVPGYLHMYQFALILIDSLTELILIYCIYLYTAKHRHKNSVSAYFFYAIWVVALFSFHEIVSGRPEILGKLFVALFILNNLRKTGRQHFINGLLIGFSAINSPIATFYLIIITGCILFYTWSFNLRQVTTIIAGLMVVFIPFIILYPYTVTDLILTMQQHSKKVIFTRTDTSLALFIRYHMAFIIPLSIGPSVVALFYVLYKLNAAKKYYTFCLVLILMFVAAYFAFKSMPLYYNLYVLSPIVLFIVFILFVKTQQNEDKYSRVLGIFLIILLAVNSVGFIRKTAVFIAIQNNYITSANYKKTFTSVTKSLPVNKKVAVSPGLWPFSMDKIKQLTIIHSNYEMEILADTAVKIVIIQQSNSGLAVPKRFNHFKLINNQFIKNKVKLMGVTLGNTYPGYQVAIYERQ